MVTHTSNFSITIFSFLYFSWVHCHYGNWVLTLNSLSPMAYLIHNFYFVKTNDLFSSISIVYWTSPELNWFIILYYEESLEKQFFFHIRIVFFNIFWGGNCFFFNSYVHTMLGSFLPPPPPLPPHPHSLSPLSLDTRQKLFCPYL
jgi:hypothetical protein